MLLFGRGRQRNAPRIITCTAIALLVKAGFCLATFPLSLPSWLSWTSCFKQLRFFFFFLLSPRKVCSHPLPGSYPLMPPPPLLLHPSTQQCKHQTCGTPRHHIQKFDQVFFGERLTTEVPETTRHTAKRQQAIMNLFRSILVHNVLDCIFDETESLDCI